MSPTFFRSSGNTTTVKGHVLWSWQKVRKATPLVPTATCCTVPLTNWVVPTCLLASAKETQLCLEVLRAEQTPLIVITAARTVPSKQTRVRKRMMAEAEKCILSFIVGVEERDPTLSRVEIFAATSRKGNVQARRQPRPAT